MNRFAYRRPATLDQAFELKAADPSAYFVAGATDTLVKIKNGDIEPRALISLRSIPELKGIETGETVRIGSLTTISEIVEDAELAKIFPVLAEAARQLGSRQIRNVATIGGNLCNCSPCADTAPPLLVHEARVKLAGRSGSREIPLSEFFEGPGQSCLATDEILEAVLIDRPAAGARGAFFKKGRVRMDLAIASLAALITLDGELCTRVRLAAGSVAPVCLRLTKAERHLEGNPLSPELVSEAAELAAGEVTPIDDVRASAIYRRRLVEVFTRRALAAIAGR